MEKSQPTGSAPVSLQPVSARSDVLRVDIGHVDSKERIPSGKADELTPLKPGALWELALPSSWIDADPGSMLSPEQTQQVQVVMRHAKDALNRISKLAGERASPAATRLLNGLLSALIDLCALQRLPGTYTKWRIATEAVALLVNRGRFAMLEGGELFPADILKLDALTNGKTRDAVLQLRQAMRALHVFRSATGYKQLCRTILIGELNELVPKMNNGHSPHASLSALAQLLERPAWKGLPSDDVRNCIEKLKAEAEAEAESFGALAVVASKLELLATFDERFLEPSDPKEMRPQAPRGVSLAD